MKKKKLGKKAKKKTKKNPGSKKRPQDGEIGNVKKSQQ